MPHCAAVCLVISLLSCQIILLLRRRLIRYWTCPLNILSWVRMIEIFTLSYPLSWWKAILSAIELRNTSTPNAWFSSRGARLIQCGYNVDQYKKRSLLSTDISTIKKISYKQFLHVHCLLISTFPILLDINICTNWHKTCKIHYSHNIDEHWTSL